MANTSRTTIYFDRDLHKALKLKAAEIEKSVSEIVNEVIRLNLSEDLEDLASFDERKKEKSLPFEDALKRLRSSGKL
ncbi:MAG TPA: CopG family transcriptional regulator [Bdellovibrionota bacterium]|nr:CopG family transcriptional regulator [Bdellovibrionota bacterium]